MLKSVAQWVAFIAVSVGSLSGAMTWVFHKNVDRPWEVEKPRETPPPAPSDPVPTPEPVVDVAVEPEPEPAPPVAAEEPPPPPQPETIETKLRRCLSRENGIDQAALYPLARTDLVAVLAHLTEWIEPDGNDELTNRSLYAFGTLSRMGFPMKTPHRVIALARGGHATALEAVARIADARAVSLIVELLRIKPRTDAERALHTKAVFFARHTGSRRVGVELNALTRSGSQAALESLAHIGAGADRKLMTTLSRTSRNTMTRIWAVRALEAEEIMSSGDLQDRLLDAVKRSPSRGPLYDWSDWALEKIVRLKLTGAVAPLRRYHDSTLSSPPARLEAMGGRPSWDRMRLRLLVAIHRLGGPLSEAEIEAVESDPLVY